MTFYLVHVVSRQICPRLVSWRSVSSGRTGTRCVQYDFCDLKTFCPSQTTTTCLAWSRRVSSMPRYTDARTHVHTHTQTHLTIIASLQGANYLILSLFKQETGGCSDIIKILFCILQLRFINSVVEQQPRLRRQRCIFTKERGRAGLILWVCCLFLSSMVCRSYSESLLRLLDERFLRKELPQSRSDEHEFRHMGSPDDEHPTSLQLLHDFQLVPRRDPRPLCQQRSASHCEGTSEYDSTAKVGVNGSIWRHWSGARRSSKLSRFGCFTAMLQFSDST